MRSSGVTFAVDEVGVAKERAPEVPGLLQRRIASRILVAPEDYRGIAVSKNIEGAQSADEDLHPLIGAIHLAYAQHRPLVLAPDMFALAISQGIAIHLNQNAEAMRERFVRHAGQKTLVARVNDPRSIADWEAAFETFSTRLEEELGKGRVAMFTRPFSTTGPAERAAGRIALMDAFSRCFDYEMIVGCGIPEITLAGTVEDWRDLRARVRALGEWELAWWADVLAPVADQLVATAEGKIDRRFWQTIHKSAANYLAYHSSGWITRFFPYLGETAPHARNPFAPAAENPERNPWLHEGIGLWQFPSGLSRVEARLTDQHGAALCEVVAGFVCVAQSEDGLAVFPRIGWAVCEADRAEVWRRLEARHQVVARAREGDPDLNWPSVDACPALLVELYDRYASVSMWNGAVKIRPMKNLESLRASRDSDACIFADVEGGAFLAYLRAPERDSRRWAIVTGEHRAIRREQDEFLRSASIDPAELKLVAETPLELFQKLLAGGDRPYFQERAREDADGSIC